MNQSAHVKHRINRILAADPGHTRFKLALKATLSLALSALTTLLVLMLLNQVLLVPIVISGMIGMMSIIIVMDPTVPMRKVTTMLIAVSGIIGITIGALLEGFPLFIDLLMLLIITSSFYFTRFGSRYFTLGQMGFMTVYFAFTTQLPLTQLIYVYIGITIGVAFAYTFNFLVLGSTPRSLLHSIRSFHVQADVIYELFVESVVDEKVHENRFKEAQKQVAKLRSYASIVAGQLNQTEIQQTWPHLDEAELRMYLFDTCILMDSLTESLHGLKETRAGTERELEPILLRMLSSIRKVDMGANETDVQHAEEAVEQLQYVVEDLTKQQHPPMDAIFLIRRIESIGNHMIHKRFHIRQALDQREPFEEEVHVETEEPSTTKNATDGGEDNQEKRQGLTPFGKKAIQVFIASTIAIIAGKVITPIQPYWVLLTVFICMFGTESIGRVYKKGFERSVGTVIGAAIGFLLATVFSGHLVLQIIMIFLIVFISGYMASVSYTVLSVFITLSVAFMYNLLMDGLSISIMSARIIETILGASIAYIVSILIFPKKTNEKMAELSSAYVMSLKNYLSLSVQSLSKKATKDEISHASAQMDQQMKSIGEEAALIKGGKVADNHSLVGEWVTLFNAIHFYARYLMALSYEQEHPCPKEVTSSITQIEQKVAENIDYLHQLIQGKTYAASVYQMDEERKTLEKRILFDEGAYEGLIDYMYYMWQINTCIVELIEDSTK